MARWLITWIWKKPRLWSPSAAVKPLEFVAPCIELATLEVRHGECVTSTECHRQPPELPPERDELDADPHPIVDAAGMAEQMALALQHGAEDLRVAEIARNRLGPAAQPQRLVDAEEQPVRGEVHQQAGTRRARFRSRARPARLP